MSRLLSIDEVSKRLSLSKDTLRSLDNNGTLLSVRTYGGHRRWKEEDIDGFIGSDNSKKENIEEACIYGRVSSHDQKKKGDLDRQCQRLSEHCTKKKYKVASIIKDVGSGLSDSRKGLKKLFNLVVERKINKVVIEHRDRLTRFQYNLFVFFFSSYDVEIEVIRKKENNDENEELVEDVMALIASFSGKLYGRRSAKKRKNDEGH